MCWKVQLDGVVIVADEVGRPHDIEGDDEQPKERPYPDSQKRQDGKQPGREVTVSGEVGETGRQIAGNARKDEDQRVMRARARWRSRPAPRCRSATSMPASATSKRCSSQASRGERRRCNCGPSCLF